MKNDIEVILGNSTWAVIFLQVAAWRRGQGWGEKSGHHVPGVQFISDSAANTSKPPRPSFCRDSCCRVCLLWLKSSSSFPLCCLALHGVGTQTLKPSLVLSPQAGPCLLCPPRCLPPNTDPSPAPTPASSSPQGSQLLPPSRILSPGLRLTFATIPASLLPHSYFCYYWNSLNKCQFSFSRTLLNPTPCEHRPSSLLVSPPGCQRFWPPDYSSNAQCLLSRSPPPHFFPINCLLLTNTEFIYHISGTSQSLTR